MKNTTVAISILLVGMLGFVAGGALTPPEIVEVEKIIYIEVEKIVEVPVYVEVEVERENTIVDYALNPTSFATDAVQDPAFWESEEEAINDVDNLLDNLDNILGGI